MLPLQSLLSKTTSLGRAGLPRLQLNLPNRPSHAGASGRPQKSAWV